MRRIRHGTQAPQCPPRSEEHTSELQSQSNLVCRLLLEKKNRKNSPTALARNPRTPPPSQASPTHQPCRSSTSSTPMTAAWLFPPSLPTHTPAGAVLSCS